MNTLAPHELIDVRVNAIRYAARDTNIYELVRPDGMALPAYEPGAHVDLHLPNGIVRQYSLITPDQTARYTFGIKRDPASRGGSRYVHDELRVGRTLKISAPRNNFPLKEDAKHVILFAGGIGITPIWCMVQRLEALGRSWKLYYACRSRADTAFLQALHEEPSHFYNATEYGVREWFADFEIEKCEVSGNFSPGFMLGFLAATLLDTLRQSGLSPATQAQIANTRLAQWADFWHRKSDPPPGFDALLTLPQEFQRRVAGGFELRARKPGMAPGGA